MFASFADATAERHAEKISRKTRRGKDPLLKLAALSYSVHMIQCRPADAYGLARPIFDNPTSMRRDVAFNDAERSPCAPLQRRGALALPNKALVEIRCQKSKTPRF
jgi:hypothetical protein